MADQFIGLWVLVIYRDQNGKETHVTGIINNITDARDLVLSNVHNLKENYHLPSTTVTIKSLVNVEVLPTALPPQLPPPATTPAANTFVQTTSTVHSAPGPVSTHPIPVPTQPASFVDPAIVSFSRGATTSTSHASPLNVLPLATPPKPPLSSAFDIGQGHKMSPGEKPKPFVTAAPPAAMSRKSSSIGTLMQKNPSTAASYQAEKLSRKLSSSREKGSPVRTVQTSMVDQAEAADSSAFEETDDAISRLPATSSFAQAGKRTKRGKAYRVEQQQTYPSGQALNAFGGNRVTAHRLSGRKQRPKRQQLQNMADEEGWATEDINDIRDTEFDFQGNLDRFDKKSVFSQIRAEDTTADEARLVSFNRLPQRPSSGKSATTTRKNYKNTENVLETYANGQPLAERDSWNKSPELDSSDFSDSDVFDRDRGRHPTDESGRNSRRAMSRTSLKQRPVNKALISAASTSALTLHQNSSSGDLANGQEPSRGILKVASNNRSGHPLDLEKSRPCPTVHPLQMIDVETIAESEIGLDSLLITENAARGIATVAIQAFGTRLNALNHNPLPVVLVFAGNNRTGARAIAAGRHLKNHHVRVLMCLVGFEREDELLGDIKKQLKIFKQVGGKLASLEELINILKTLDSPPELIIDGILGINKTFEELRTGDQATTFQLVRFANKSNACVLSLDIPCGIDPRTGEIAHVEDSGPFHIRAKWVVALGAPKTGLLHALDSGVGSGWKLFIVDIGIPSAAWRKYRSRRRYGIEFGADWVVPLDYYAPH